MKLLKSFRFWFGVGFVLLLIALRYSGLGDYLTLERVQEQREALGEFVGDHYAWAVLIYMLWYVLIVTLALPITALSTVVGGFFFGTIPAAIYTNVGATAGALCFFFLMRYFWGNALQNQNQKRLRWFNEQVKLHGIYYLIFMRFLAIIPFFVANLLAAFSNISAWTFVWTTSVGIIPGSLVYAFAGRQLTTITSIQDVFSWNILLAFLLLALLALTPVFVQWYRGTNRA